MSKLGGDECRNIIKESFKKAFEKYDEFKALSEEQQSQIIRRIERNCLNSSREECLANHEKCVWNNNTFLNIYSSKVALLLENIDPDSLVNTKSVGLKIISGDLDVRKICEYKSQDLFPEISEKERNLITIKQNQHVQQKHSERYSCPKCNKKLVQVVETQTRSLDEASVFKFICCNETCGHVWIAK